MTARAARSYGDVVVAAPVTVPYERYSTRSAHWFLARALALLVEAAGVPKARIDGLSAASFTLAPDTAVGLTEMLGLSPRWLDHVPMGGAAALVALRRAARAVQSGDADMVACLAGDTNHPDSFRSGTASFSRFARDAAYPYGAGGPNASFALITDHYMRTHGATAEDFGRLCCAQRENARANPNALLRKPLSMADYLGARVVADPIRLFDCVMPCAGAEGFLVTRREIAEDLDLPCARLLASIERHNAFADDPVQVRGGWAMDRDALWRQAGVAPADIDLLEAYDDYPVVLMMQLEGLGFCAKGEAPEFVRAHDFTVGGSFPLNTSGGQLSAGQAGAAGGHLGLVEAVRQLTGAALGAQVPDARLGVVSGFGMVNYDRGLSTAAAVLGAAD